MPTPAPAPTPKCPSIEEIETKWKKDSKLDKTMLAENSLDVDYLHAEWLGIYRMCKEQLTRLQYMLDKKQFDAKEYYSGKADTSVYKDKPFDKKVMKTDLDRYVNVDPDVAKVSIATDKAKLKVELCESILKQIAWRSNSIRNAISYIKFLNGETS